MPETGEGPKGSEQGPKIESKPWILGDPKQLEEIKNPQLKRIISLLEKTPQNMRKAQLLEKCYEDILTKGEIPEDEAGIFLSKIGEKHEEISKREGEKVEKPAVEEPTVKLEDLQDIEERIAKLNEKDKREGLTADEIQTLNQLSNDRDDKRRRRAAMGFPPESAERPPDIEKVGPDEYRKWFKKRLHALIQEYPDQDFGANWTLIYPIQQAVNNLTDRYSTFRRELVEELESHRALHNFIYYYKRADGIRAVVMAGGLLATPYVEHLLKEKGEKSEKSVADVLRELEAWGEKHKSLTDSLLFLDYYRKEAEEKVVANEIREKIERLTSFLEDSKKKELKEKMVTKEVKDWLIDEKQEIFNKMSDLQKENWQGRVAGGLYSALNEAARHDIIFNESGDLHMGRVFNMAPWAKKYWERAGREPYVEFYRALELRLDGFWQLMLETRLKDWDKDPLKDKFKESCEEIKIEKVTIDKEGVVWNIKTDKDAEGKEIITKNEVTDDSILKSAKFFIEFCKKMGIEITINEKGERDYSFKNYSLEGAKFEEMNFTDPEKKNYFAAKSDQVRFTCLDPLDADEVRRVLFAANGLVQGTPSLKHISAIWEQFKHHQGIIRSDWMQEVSECIIRYFKDRVAPGIDENWPDSLRWCRAKEISKDIVPWTNTQIRLMVQNITPPLIPDDAKTLLKNVHVGGRVRGKVVEGLKTSGGVVGAMIGRAIKVIFESLLGG